MNKYFIHLVSKITYHLKRAGLLVSLFCFISLTSCSNRDRVLATVDDQELLESDAYVLMKHLGYDVKKPKELKLFVQSWIEQETLRQELMQSDPENYKLVEMRSASFAGELSKFYLLEQYISKLADTVISEKELSLYYEQHKQEFALQDYLVKALYIKIPLNTKAQEPLKEHFLLKNDKDLSKVNSYAKLYAENFYFDDQEWIYFNDLTKDIPLKDLNRDNIVLNRTKTYFSDGEFTYFLNILDYKLKDSAPPFEFLRDQIREIILSKRMNALREKHEATLIKKIKKKHDIKDNS